MSPIEIRREIKAVNTNTPFEKYRLGYTVNGGELQSLRIEGRGSTIRFPQSCLKVLLNLTNPELCHCWYLIRSFEQGNRQLLWLCEPCISTQVMSLVGWVQPLHEGLETVAAQVLAGTSCS